MQRAESDYLANEAFGAALEPAERQRTPFGRVYEEPGVFTLLVNSWRNFPWYELDFGTGIKPARVGVKPYFRTQARYVHVEECNAQGDVRIFTLLRAAEGRRLRAFLGAMDNVTVL